MKGGHYAVVAAMALSGALIAATPAASAGEIQFLATSPGEGATIWEPTTVLIDQREDLKGGLVFVVKNLTKVEHAFAVQGLYELILTKETEQVDVGVEVEKMNYTLKPIRLNVPAGQTKRIRVNTAELQGPHALGKRFRVFCPIHKDIHLGGSIYVAG